MATDDTPLFRKEAIEALGSRLGSTIKPVDVSGTVLTAFLLTVLVGALIFLSTAQYARKETVAGVIEPSEGAARVVAPKPGVVVSILAHEGQRVSRGAPLFIINEDVVTNTGETLGSLLVESTNAQSRALNTQIDAHRLSSDHQRAELNAKREGLLDHLLKLNTDLELQRARIRLQEQSLESFRLLNEKKIVSDLQYRDRQDNLIQARQLLSSIEKDTSETKSNIAQVDAELTRLSSDLSEAEAQLSASRAQVREREATNSISKEILIPAPKSGRVVAITVKPGAAVVNSAALGVILPDGAKLTAQLWAPSRAAGFVRPGDSVRIMMDAFPFQKFGVVHGKVSGVASAPTPPTELTVPIETKESLYRVDVALERQDIDGYGKTWPFAPGMRLSADLILEKRTFIEWLLDPLYASMRRSRD